MKVKAILRRRPGGGGGVPGRGSPRRAGLLGASPLRLPSLCGPTAPLTAHGQREVTGPPRPQPGRERQAALGAAAGPSAGSGAFTSPSARNPARSFSRWPPPGRGAALMWGPRREVPNRAPAGKARAPELRPGARAAEPPRPGPQRAGFRAPEAGRLGGSGWGRKEEARRQKLGQFVGGSFEIALGPSKLSPCDCRVTQPASSNSRKAWGRPRSRRCSLFPSPFQPTTYQDLLSLPKQKCHFGGWVGGWL